MNKLILLVLIVFLFSLSSVYAYDITECGYINTQGNYILSQNITSNTTWCNTEVACITINTSSVTLNLNGHSIVDNGGCYDGVYINQNPDYPDTFMTDEIITNGNILGFNNNGIVVNGVNTTTINNLHIINYGSGNGIYVNQPLNQLTIQNNYIETGGYAVYSGLNFKDFLVFLFFSGLFFYCLYLFLNLFFLLL
jgi:hypothetical protein